MISRFRAAVAGTASRMKQAILGSRPGLELPPFPTCAAEPIDLPPLDSSPLYPRRLLLTTGIHFYRTWFVGDGTGAAEKQLFELKTRLTVLGTYKSTTLCTAEQIRNHPLLDLKSLPLLNNLVVTEYINMYVDLCKKYCPFKSEVSKNELLKKLEEDRRDEMFNFYQMQLHIQLFKTSFPRTNEG